MSDQCSPFPGCSQRAIPRSDVTTLSTLQLKYVGHEQGYLHRHHLNPQTVSQVRRLSREMARTRSRIPKSLRSLMNMLPALIGPTVCELLGPTGIQRHYVWKFQQAR